MSGHIDEDEYERQEYAESDPEEFDLENDLEEGEVNLFASMPWINENVGSMMDATLLRFKEPNQCRQCGKLDDSLRTKKVEERFCSDKCSKEWHSLLEIRLAQGRHDLRTRGYD